MPSQATFLYDLKRHAPFWILIYIIWTYIKSQGGDVHVYLVVNVFNLTCYMVAYYTLIYFYIPLLFNSKKYLLFFLSIVLTSFLLLLFMQINDAMWFSQFGSWETESISGGLYLRKAIQHYSPGLILLAWETKLESLKEKNRIQTLEKDKLDVELKFLRSQLNPHFLFNVLNNIYSMAIQNNQKEIAEGIENLSGIMRYMTYDSTSEEVPLSEDLRLLRNYIDLMQLNFDSIDDSFVSFNIIGNPKGHFITPTILLPLVENAFKHGMRPSEKCLVNIKMEINDQRLELYIKNTLFNQSAKSNQNEEGIGLLNVKKILNIKYPNSHVLKLKTTDDYFLTYLEIMLGSKNV